MSTTTYAIIIVVVAIAVIGLVALWLISRRQRSQRLQQDFGPEYERALRQADNRGQAEKELEARQKRVEKLHLRDLTTDEQRRYADAWRLVQARFVDDPGATIDDADALVLEVMKARGYPMGDFEARAADISVDHPEVVPNYRAAHAMAEKHKQEALPTEQLRQAIVHYRALFDDLLGAPASRTTGRVA